MANLSIVVADAWAARIYQKACDEPGLQPVREFVNPADADDSQGYGIRRFARDLGAFLEFSAIQNAGGQMVIAASHDFLPALRAALGPATKQCLVCLLDSDLTRSPIDDLESRLGSLLDIPPAARN
jgi:protein required for attachment to host cells